jgi:hypothetical protein
VTDYILKQAKGSKGQQFVPDRIPQTLKNDTCSDAERKLKRKIVFFFGRIKVAR